MPTNLRVLGIDPGSNFTGFGVIEVLQSGKITYVASGKISAHLEDLPSTLKIIFKGITDIVQEHHPLEVAVESVFVGRNAQSALKLGQARGAAIAAAILAGLTFAEYSAKQVKQSVVGMGNAKKSQVQFMIQHLLDLSNKPGPDAADALACALCHCQHRKFSHSMAKQTLTNH